MSPEDKYRADILDPIAWLDGTNEPTRWVDNGTHADARPTRPDDSEINTDISNATSLMSALWLISEKYDINLTNNEPRWQDGVYLRHIADFLTDVVDAAVKFDPKNPHGNDD